MKFLTSILLTAIFSFLLQLYLPWWSLVIAAFAVGALISRSGLISFAGGFTGTGIVWLVYAWLIDRTTDSILSDKIAELFHLGNPIALMFIGAMLAGVVGGFAALSGNALRKLF